MEQSEIEAFAAYVVCIFCVGNLILAVYQHSSFHLLTVCQFVYHFIVSCSYICMYKYAAWARHYPTITHVLLMTIQLIHN